MNLSIQTRIIVLAVMSLLLATATGFIILSFLTPDTIGAINFTTLLKAWCVNLFCIGGLVLILAVIFKGSVSSPLARIIDFTRSVAAGESDAKIQGEFAGEFAELKDSIQNMVRVRNEKMVQFEMKEREAEQNAQKARDSLAQAEKSSNREAVRRKGMVSAGETLGEISTSIKEATNALANEASDVSNGTEQQKQRVEETVTALQQMTDTIYEVAKNTSETSSVADKTRERAQNGADIVDRSVNAIDEVRTLTEALKENMGQLGEQAESIGQIMNVISDIADQTNLLALNAAIEAARAGDAGRGFAVVADEVRKLAEKTMQATHEVGTAITSIQQGARDNIQQMDKASEAVEHATELAGESGQALHEIVSLVDMTTDQVRVIATASEEQSAASEEIKRAMDQVQTVSVDTASGMQRSMDTIHKIEELIEELTKMHGVFRTIGDGKAQELVESMCLREDMLALGRDACESTMRQAVGTHSFLELMYLTDGRGKQITHNIAPKALQSANDAAALGKNWSERPWFTGVLQEKDTYVSPIYISEASGEYCLTIASPMMRGTEIVGVLAADIKLFT